MLSIFNRTKYLLLGSTSITTSFTATQVIAGIAGPTDIVTNAARCQIRASVTTWFGRMRGKEASLTIASHAAGASVIQVSVDGGAFTNLTSVANKVTLFSGLSDTWHTVAFKPGSAYGNLVYLSVGATNILTVTGANPAIETANNNTTAMLQVGKTGDFTASALTDNATANFVPSKYYTDGVTPAGRNGGSLIGRTTTSKLYISTKADYVAVSVDGAAPTYYDVLPASTGGGVIVPCDGVAHDYYIWDSGFNSGSIGNILSVGSDGVWSDLASEKRLHHIGHSIVHGSSATSGAHTDMGRTAARNGYAFGNFGVAGNTINALKLRIDSLLALLTVTSSDVAVLDIGRNDGDVALDAGEETDMNYVIDALQVKGYGKILVLGQMTQTGFSPDSNGLNTSISNLVTAQADANCIFISRSAYTGIATADNVHPTDAGYVTMDGFNATYLDPSIP